MSVIQDIRDLEQQIKNAKELIAQRQMAQKLSDNHEFRKLFLEDYFVQEAARLVQCASDPSLTREQQDTALEMAKATGHTKRYLSIVVQMGAHSERELPNMEAELVELRSMPEGSDDEGQED